MSKPKPLSEQIRLYAIKVLVRYNSDTPHPPYDCPSCGLTYVTPHAQHAENCYDLRADALNELDRGMK